MASRAIKKHLNLIEDCCSCDFTGFNYVASYFLQAPKEGLDGHIIISFLGGSCWVETHGSDKIDSIHRD